MSEIILNFDIDVTYAYLRSRFESITREYSLSVVEGIENGKDYPEASENIRFLNDFLFNISCAMEDNKSETL